MIAFGFGLPSAAWLFSAIVPLVALYFLKLRRPRETVSSLTLWRRVIEDDRVNSPFQRFKRNLLLWMQLFVLCLLVLAAMGPFVGAHAAGERMLILVDHSASMGAVGESDRRSRLELARVEIETLIDSIDSGRQIALIGFARRPRLLSGFTDNKRTLRAALAGFELEHVPADLDNALRMAVAIGQATPFESAILFSDGNLAGSSAVPLAFELTFSKLEAAGPNLGITGVSAQRMAASGWSVFVQVEGSPGQPLTADLELLISGEVRTRETVAFDGTTPERLAFLLEDVDQQAVELRLRPRGFDSFDLDDRAFLELEPRRPLDVWVEPGLESYRSAFEAIGGVRIAESAAGVDLVVERDGEHEAPVRWTDGVVPDAIGELCQVFDEPGMVVDWAHGHSLLDHVDLTEIALQQTVRWRQEVVVGDLEKLGYEVIVDAGRGPLVVGDPKSRVFHCLVDTQHTTLPYRVAFPILVSNLERLTRSAIGLGDVAGQKTGVLAGVTLRGAESMNVTVRGPGGSLTEAYLSGGEIRGVSAGEVGVYEVMLDGAILRRVGAALLDPHETSLRGVEEIRSEDSSYAGRTAAVEADQPIWRYLVTLACAVMLIEWWWYTRRARVSRVVVVRS